MSAHLLANLEDGYCSKNRDFVCACGKNYLSYAALFTHIKQKHNGKAPGPIIRPRSERKRGRPRKTLSAENENELSDLEQPQNGISSIIEINNINQKEEKREQTQKAAELLGCGGFKAFQAYRPDPPINFLSRRDSETSRKMPPKKKSIFEESQRSARSPFSLCMGKGSSFLPKQESQIKIEKSIYMNAYAVMKIELKNILASISDPVNKTLELNGIKLEKLNENPLNSSITISQALYLFLCEAKEVLKIPKQTPTTPYNNYEQLSLFLHILLEFFHQKLGNKLQTTSAQQIPNFTVEFIEDYLDDRIDQWKISNLQIFSGYNPILLLLNLCNWLTLREQIQYLKANCEFEDYQQAEESLTKKQSSSDKLIENVS